MSIQQLTVDTARLRVTSYITRHRDTLIKGVPVLVNNKTASARYNIQITVDNELLPVVPAPGQMWTVSGKRAINTVNFGDFLLNIHSYVRPESLEFTLPNDGETFIQFIAKDPAFKGIGESKARELWHRFGLSIHEILQATGDKYLADLRGILSDRSIKALYSGYEKYQNLRHTLWMTNAGIPVPIQRRILKYHGQGSVESIKSNPYELVNFDLSVDKIDQLCIGPSAPWEGDFSNERIKAAVIQGVRESLGDGSTYTRSTKLSNKIFRILKNKYNTDCGLALLKKLPSVAVYNESEDRFHPTATAIQELAVAKRLKYLACKVRDFNQRDQEVLNRVLKQIPHQLTDKQIGAVKALLVNEVACLTGGAGTGKTFTCNAFLKTAVAIGYDVHCVALSGRAAMRLHESIGLITKTIARFLRDDPVICESGQKRLLLIDEASMVDLPTMFKIINHISPAVKIVFIGDPNQLPPIGVGKILHDLSKSNLVSNSVLDIVKRQKGSTGIPEYTAAIKEGIVPSKLTTDNVYFHEVLRGDIGNAVIKLYLADPHNTRVISSTRKTATLLNSEIQKSFNGESPRLEFHLNDCEYYLNLKLNDHILFTKNYYDLGVQNGTLGTLINVEQKESTIGLVRTDTGELVELTDRLLESIDLGYAITLHKAQGSQFPRIIVVLEENCITDRSWLYTAITRAEFEVHILGNESIFRKVIETPSKAFKRNTLLSELIEWQLDNS